MADLIDLRAVRRRRVLQRLRSLQPCGRCADGRDEKCTDRSLPAEESFTAEEVTCGCGCWTRPALDQWAGTVRTLLGDVLVEQSPADGTCRCVHGCQRIVRYDGPDSEMFLCGTCGNYVCVSCGTEPVETLLSICDRCGWQQVDWSRPD